MVMVRRVLFSTVEREATVPSPPMTSKEVPHNEPTMRLSRLLPRRSTNKITKTQPTRMIERLINVAVNGSMIFSDFRKTVPLEGVSSVTVGQLLGERIGD